MMSNISQIVQDLLTVLQNITNNSYFNIEYNTIVTQNALQIRVEHTIIVE